MRTSSAYDSLSEAQLEWNLRTNHHLKTVRAEGLPQDLDRMLAGAVTGGNLLHTELAQGISDLLDSRILALVEMKPSDDQ